MGRPVGYQWQPLGLDSDPVPGDPAQIGQEAQHLSSVAKQITSEVAALRKIASDNVECGQHADVIRSSASDLAGQLDKVVGRYQKVSSALNGWIPDLEKAQSMSIQALNQAEGPYRQLSTPVIMPSGNNLTAQQKQDVQNYNNAMRAAQGELDAAKALLAQATTLRDNSASYHAGLINKACDDGVKDSWWDSFEDWVSQYAGIIKDICTVLEYIATILAIIALFIPGLDIIVILGIVATALALVGRTMLAATGNGSWIDVALDAFALLTFGMGKIVGKMMESTFETAEDVAKSLRAAKIAESPAGRLLTRVVDFAGDMKSSSMLKGAVGFLKDLGLSDLSEGLTRGVGKAADFIEEVGNRGLEHVAPSVEKTLAGVSHDIKPGEVALYGGEKESLLMTRNMNTLNKLYGDAPEFAQLNSKFQSLLNIQRGTFGATTTFDLSDKSLTGIQWYGIHDGEHPVVNAQFTDGWTNIKDSAVGGLSTSTADGIVDVASVVAPAVGLPMQGFRLAMSEWG
jgi:hypothetical protein